MPFVNSRQRAACYAQARAARKRGESPKWDCKKWDRHKTPRKKSVRKSRKPIRRRSKSVKRKSRKPIRRRSKSVRKRSRVVQHKPKYPKSVKKSVKPKYKKYHSRRRIKKSIPQQPPTLQYQMSIENPRNLLSITNPININRRPYTPLYRDRVPQPPKGYDPSILPTGRSRFKKYTKMKRRLDEDNSTYPSKQLKLSIENICKKLQCYTRINEISLNVIKDYNTEKSREDMFEDLFTFMWGKIMSDPIFNLKMGINPNLKILVYPYMVVDLLYGKDLLYQITNFIKKIKALDTMSESDHITPFELGTPNHIIPGIIRWRTKTIEMYDMNEVASEIVMQNALEKVMRVENPMNEEGLWKWKWDFSCAPFHSEILKEVHKCAQEYNLTFPEGLCASISIFMVIKNLQAPTKSLSEIYREVSERLVTPGGIKGVLNEMLKYFELLNEWYGKFYCFFMDWEPEKQFCLYNKDQFKCQPPASSSPDLSNDDLLEKDLLGEFYA